jgi:hypothetical protein
MIDEAEIPSYFYRVEYQTPFQIDTDKWEKGNSYEEYEGAQRALSIHTNRYPDLPVRVKRVTLMETCEILGRYHP